MTHEEKATMAEKDRRHLSRRAFLRVAGGSVLAAGALGSGGFLYTRDLEPGWVEVVRRRLALARLPGAFRGYRIVHVSDLHLDDLTEARYLDEIVGTINDQGADLVAFTGDFVTFSPGRQAGRLSETLGRLEARDGTVAVLGNHDHQTDPAAIEDALLAGGATVLRNGVRSLTRDGAALHVCGLDDAWMGDPDLAAILENLPDAGASVLLVHEPDFADVSSPTGRFDLQLSGHSHGGQVRLPFVGAPVLPEYARRYPSGLYGVGNMLLYTNRGLGMLPPRFRLLCRPEITVLDLDTMEAAGAAPA